jgi:hypothetical protein
MSQLPAQWTQPREWAASTVSAQLQHIVTEALETTLASAVGEVVR